MLVQVTAPGDHLCIDLGGSAIDFLMDADRSGDILRLRVCRNRAEEATSQRTAAWNRKLTASVNSTHNA